MIRFLSFLFNKPYETCKSCETLKQQLAIANAEKERLTETLLEIFKPKVYAASPVELNVLQGQSSLFARRRAAAEERDRIEATTRANSHVMAKEDSSKSVMNNSIDNLETELGIKETVNG